MKASAQIAPESHLDLETGPRFVSRGGDKLEAALLAFPLDVSGRVCVDVGASTGGFTDCLLQHGAAKVYTIDVGKGILHWKLRSDSRVVVMEKTNARYVESLPESPDLVTIDASFISLKILLPVVKLWFPSRLSPPFPVPSPNGMGARQGGSTENEGDVLALIKPQFEAGRKASARHKGVIRDPAVHKAILLDVLAFAQVQGFGLRGLLRCLFAADGVRLRPLLRSGAADSALRGLLRSPVLGPKGNVEFLAWLGVGQAVQTDFPALIQPVLGE